MSLEKRLTIQYRPVGQDALKVYNWLNPLGLVFFGDIYLVATVKNYRNPLQFRLNRVQTANILNEPALHPAGFSLQGYVECGGFHQIKKKPLKG